MVRRYVILSQGHLRNGIAKTAHGLLRFRPNTVAAVLDTADAGARVNEVLPSLESNAPIVATLGEAMRYDPTSLLVGVANVGGQLPRAFRPAILEAIDQGLEIVSGLHEFLNDDSEFVARAARSGAHLWDVREVPEDIPIFSGRAYDVSQHVVLAVGSDCAVGKMTAMLRIEEAALSSGAHAEFVATGQTGIIIAGRGIAVDRVVSDFVAGAAEKLVLEASADSDVLLVEGQGAILHPAYASVTLGLMYGCAPDALILCHRPGARSIDGFSTPIPDLPTLIHVHEDVLKHVKPARVVAVALDTSKLDAAERARTIADAERQTGLPVDDPVLYGGDKLWSAIAAALEPCTAGPR
jgi:uncharacterized NAD-dependent epimerase/dehydratase family protein